MPRSVDTPICGSAKITCYDQAEDDLLHEQYINGIDANKGSPNECNCLPACTSIKYDAEISQAPYDWKNLFKAFNTSDENPG